MPDFHIKMNRMGTLLFANKIKPLDELPEPWKFKEDDSHWYRSTALLEKLKEPTPEISMVIQAPDMCTAVKILDERRKKDIVMGLL